ncbi:hypothetical protein BS78_05G203300 [Paspalum vaginatum]|nr:hypothetical protein BS78_05G203300 [Paspalum vaginatum]
MAIVGPVGVATTLAKELRSRLIRCGPAGGGFDYFQHNVMAQASQGRDRNKLLLQDILSQVSSEHGPAAPALSSYQSQPETMEMLVRLVSQRLQNKRYFIIIDDLWRKSDWKKIKCAFPTWECCYDSDSLVHEMKPLNQMDSEKLLLAKACSPTDGCPLPVVNVKPQAEDEAEEHKRFASHHEEQAPHLPKRIEQALSSAFGNLDYGFRLACLYMLTFRYGYKFDVDRLICKWCCEGLLENQTDGEILISWLVDMNVITCSAAADSKHNLDEAETRQLHVNHFMHQFLASKSAETGFVFTSATLHLMAAASAPRRLALHHPDPNIPSLLEAMDLSQTRSLSVSGAVTRIYLNKFVHLVVLDLEGWENLRDEDLVHVCKMYILVYLSVRNTRVSKLPKEIIELWTLRLLDVSYTHIDELPMEVFKLQYLEGLDLLPKQIVGLRRLKFLLVDPVKTRVPDDVRHLERLETLATVDLTQHHASFVRALGDLRKLQVLAVTWSFHQSTDEEYREALLSSIQKWRWLESIIIHCGLGCSREFLGSQMDAPPKYLEKLKVTAGRFANVPRWLEGLAFVQITICKQGKGDLEILGGLPKLHRLILGLDFIPGGAVVIENTGFDELQKLSIDCPMPWLTFSQGAMPRLTCLQLKFCATPAKQHSVPSGIVNLRRITEVALCYNAQYINSPSVKTTVDAVRKQVDEHRNPIDLFINSIEQDDVQVYEVTEYAIGSSSRIGAGVADEVLRHLARRLQQRF